jgi:2-dehydro-3-deoxygluconokinase
MDVVTIGESMVVFTAQTDGMMRYAQSFSKKIGGAESNVAVGLARLGHSCGWISKVGNDEFGQSIISFLKGEDVDTSRVLTAEKSPTGIYFKELRRPNDIRVYYYRKGSAASTLSPVDLDREYISKAKYLHITGITPALSEDCRNTIFEAIKIAKNYGVKIIFDPNLRTKLWDEETARKTLLEITSKVDIILPGIAEGEFLLNEKDPTKLGEEFLKLGPSTVIIKVGEKGAFYFNNVASGLVRGFPVKQVVDPVGAGDGFAAGFISGLLDGLPLSEAVARANAAGALVTMVNGDVDGLPSREEINRFIGNNEADIIR